MGASAVLVMGCRKAGIDVTTLDLTSIRQLGAAGSAPPTEGYAWVYDQLGPDVLLNCGSGGTDVCTGIVQSGPLQPVCAGEIAGRCLAVDSAAFDPAGARLSARPASSSSARRCQSASGTTLVTSAITPPTSTTTPASGATATRSCLPSAAAV
jgi:acyl-coenzyme A synthetase/AMP-(fatty) acid ligase